ncbi:hypothetical protein Vadar_009164 [Vaccinium darrowii]|uniref:Uncharacterized protein n=1 Tax=Vaccinium darrowii TaxID=229202 RepID=A0ACB7YU63_9ERIC|nr:hypothetical protein Vadar_009164 [Vaccinium darrowii]
MRMAAIRGAVSIGRKANSSLSPNPIYLTTQFHAPPPASRPFHVPISHAHAPSGFKYPIRAIHEATVDPVVSRKDEEGKSPDNWKVKMLYDGECPLCMREVNMLRERDKQYGAINFVDISSDAYNPKENQGLDYKTVMGRIHAILSDGTVVTDVEAFRKLYEAVDLGWVYAITKYEPIATIADGVYGFWAKYRLQITGRPSLEEVLEARKNKGEVCNDSKVCKM